MTARPGESAPDPEAALRSEGIAIDDLRDLGPRARARVLDLERVARDAQASALRRGAWSYHAEHGGTVANAYSRKAYRPASTDAVVAVADPLGRVLVLACRIPANKATLSGAAAAAAGDAARALWDRRVPEGSPLEDAARAFLRGRHAEEWGPALSAEVLEGIRRVRTAAAATWRVHAERLAGELTAAASDLCDARAALRQAERDRDELRWRLPASGGNGFAVASSVPCSPVPSHTPEELGHAIAREMAIEGGQGDSAPAWEPRRIDLADDAPRVATREEAPAPPRRIELD